MLPNANTVGLWKSTTLCSLSGLKIGVVDGDLTPVANLSEVRT